MFDLGTVFDTDLKIEGISLDAAEDMASVLLSVIQMDFLGTELLTDAQKEEIITDFERIYGASSGTAAQRLSAVKSRMVAVGSMRRSTFENIAIVKGYKIGTHGTVGDPHLRITEGDYVPFRADYGEAGDPVYEDGSGLEAYKMNVYGTLVESDDALQAVFNDLKPANSQFVFTNE